MGRQGRNANMLTAMDRASTHDQLVHLLWPRQVEDTGPDLTRVNGALSMYKFVPSLSFRYQFKFHTGEGFSTLTH